MTFDARADALDVRIDATSPEQRDALKDAVARHLDRFAFREAPLHLELAGYLGGRRSEVGSYPADRRILTA